MTQYKCPKCDYTINAVGNNIWLIIRHVEECSGSVELGKEKKGKTRKPINK